jgi:hypothetical protein
MESKELKHEIFKRFGSYKAFLKAFNKAGGDLTPDVLSHQLNGRRGISKFSAAAYKFFFLAFDMESALMKFYLSEFESIDGVNQHPSGLNFYEWCESNNF